MAGRGAPAATIETRPLGAVTLVRLHGEHDVHAVPAFNREIAQLLADGRCRMVLDLSEATFLDSRMVGAVLGWVQVSRDAGPLRLVLVLGDAAEGPAALVRMVGDEALLPVAVGVDEAAAALAA